MTTAFSGTTTAAAMTAAEVWLGSANWRAKTPDQQHLLAIMPVFQAAAAGPYGKWVNGYARPTAEELNAILESEGFDIRLGSWAPVPGAFGTVGLSDVTVSWRKKGEPTVIFTDDDSAQYPAFRLDAEANGRVVQLDGFAARNLVDGFGADNLVVELTTREDLRVRVVMMPEPGGWRQLTDAAQKLWHAPVVSDQYMDSIVLPKVSMDEQPDINWMVGMSVGSWAIGQALQQCKFAMNEHGARVKEATAFGFESMKPTFFVNRPFLIVIGDPAAEVPVFQAHLTQECWKDPGNLSDL
jgi:hypothetical protein